MPSSKPDNVRPVKKRIGTERRKFNQLGLDFVPVCTYVVTPRKETEAMNLELVELLEQKIGDIVEKYTALKEENNRLTEEIQRLSSEREGIKSRVDSILGKLDGI